MSDDKQGTIDEDSIEEIVDRTLEILDGYISIPKATAKAMVLSFYNTEYMKQE